MSTNISFDDNKFKYKSRTILGQSEVPGITKFLISKGIVKNEKQAQGILLGITTSCLIASAYVFAVFVFDVQLFNKTPTQTPEQIQRIQENRERIQKIREQNQNNTNNTTNTQ